MLIIKAQAHFCCQVSGNRRSNNTTQLNMSVLLPSTMSYFRFSHLLYIVMNPASILRQVYLMKICPMISSFHLPHNTTKCQRAEEGRMGGKKNRREGAWVSTGNMTCLALRKWSKEGVKQRGRERDGGRPATSSLTVHWAAHVSTLHPSSGSNSRTLGQTVPHTYIWDTF